MIRDHLPKAKLLHWNRTIFVWVALFLPSLAGFAQDLHYSQFYGAPLHLNPSLTGIFRGDVRIMGQYRNQWSQVPVGYTTYTGAVDFKALGRNGKDNFLAFGLGYNRDQAGLSDLRLNSLTLNGAFTKKLDKRFYGSVGAQIGFSNRKWQADQVTYDSQYNPNNGTFNPQNPIGEKNNDQSLGYTDFGLGFNVRYQVKEREEQVDTSFGQRTKIDFGLGLFHLNRPNQYFTEFGAIKLPMRWSPYIMGDFQLTKRWDLIANVAGQFQSSYRQYLGGLGARYYLNRNAGHQLSLQAGFTVRFDGFTKDFATYPALEARYNNIRVGFSYDINASQFNDSVKGGVGGPEVFIHYHIVKYKQLPVKKICPLI
jgi:type IX secretion system PorP/SprF family membrane protein